LIPLLLLALPLAAASGDPLTAEQAVALALRTHPDLLAARGSAPAAGAQLRAAAALPSPELRVSSSNLSLDEETLEIRTNFGLRWSPPRPREMNLKQRLARARLAGVEAEVRSAETRLAASVRLAYRRAALAEERVRIARQALELRRRMTGVVRKQVAAGLKEAGEIDLAALAEAEAALDLDRAEALTASEKLALAGLIGFSASDDLNLAPEPALFRSPAILLSRQELTAVALDRNAGLHKAAAACSQAKAAEDLSRSLRYPWISFVQVTRRLEDIPGRGSWGFQVGIDLPIFRTAPAVQPAVVAAETRRCLLDERALRSSIAREIDSTVASLEAGARELVELERLQSGLAAQALERARSALDSGRADRVDVLVAEVRCVTLRDRWLERRMEYARLEAHLEIFAGRENP
jgi:cobalt-zinc-cadmium efflux system outer membrane protein